MRKWIYVLLSMASLVLFLFAYQNCGKSYQSGDNTLQSVDSNGTEPDIGTPSPNPGSLPSPPVICAARSPLKNQLQNLGSAVDRVAVLDSFPLAMEASPVCSLQALPYTTFIPPLRTAPTFRAYMDTWIEHARYVMNAGDNHLRLPNNHTSKAELASCVLDHLHQLASRNLFAEPMDSYADNQGEYERNHMLGSFNISFNKIRNEASLPADRLRVVQNWLGNSGTIVMNKFNQHISGRPERRNSNLYWAGVTLMVAGLNTSNNALYNRGVEFIQMGLDQIQANGVLPIEMSSGAEAFRRHVFALQYLLYAAQIAKLNNLDLFTYGNNALSRLARLVINSFKDFSQFQRLTTVTQTYLPSNFITQAKWDLAWMETYFAHTGDVDLLPYLSTLRPIGNHYIGRATYSYGLTCLAASP